LFSYLCAQRLPRRCRARAAPIGQQTRIGFAQLLILIFERLRDLNALLEVGVAGGVGGQQRAETDERG
jgi:hypothetical protein